ncbi:MAG TPA: hypothetical protein VK524_11855 [Polyangiaceae bacterium]|nr:hypothetical protein [Polyangiaceae bacterium]
MSRADTARSPRRLRAALGPLLIAHALAYPATLLSALACMPLVIAIRTRALMAAGPDGAVHPMLRDVARDLSLTQVEAAQVQLVLEVALGVALLVFLLVHLAALPWAWAETRAPASGPAEDRDRDRGRRSFAYAFAMLLGALLVLGAGSWLWLLVLSDP